MMPGEKAMHVFIEACIALKRCQGKKPCMFSLRLPLPSRDDDFIP
jgi:hypothetical protein